MQPWGGLLNKTLRTLRYTVVAEDARPPALSLSAAAVASPCSSSFLSAASLDAFPSLDAHIEDYCGLSAALCCSLLFLCCFSAVSLLFLCCSQVEVDEARRKCAVTYSRILLNHSNEGAAGGKTPSFKHTSSEKAFYELFYSYTALFLKVLSRSPSLPPSLSPPLCLSAFKN